jgi:hypothetical protein
MGDTATQTLIHAGLLFAAIAGLAALGIWVVARFRGSEDSDQPTTSELLSKFRHLHEQGKLSDAEFRNIKTLLAAKLQHEIKDNAEKG